MFKINLTSKSFALLACTALLVSALGCNSGLVTAPESDSARIVNDPGVIHILSTSSKDNNPLMRTQSAKGMVSAEFGGTVSNGWVTLDFPATALDEDTEISISMSEPDKLIVELEPHGIHFNKPVMMTLELEGTDAEGMADQARVLWFNEEMGWWEEMKDAGIDDSNHNKAFLEHFSKYANTIGG